MLCVSAVDNIAKQVAWQIMHDIGGVMRDPITYSSKRMMKLVADVGNKICPCCGMTVHNMLNMDM